MSLSLTSLNAPTPAAPADAVLRVNASAESDAHASAGPAFADCLDAQDPAPADAEAAPADDDAQATPVLTDAAALLMPWLAPLVQAATPAPAPAQPLAAPTAAPAAALPLGAVSAALPTQAAAQAAAPAFAPEAATDLAPPVTTWSAAVDVAPPLSAAVRPASTAESAAGALAALLARQAATAESPRPAAGEARGTGTAPSGALLRGGSVGLPAASDTPLGALLAARPLTADAGLADDKPAAPDSALLAPLQRFGASLDAGSTAAALPDAGDARLSLPGDGRAWQQPLLQALGDRLQVQIASRSEQARLHLEPPQLGRIEIEIRQQGGALQVQLSATNDEVRQQLRQISEPLRHDLVQRHSGEVSVQVGQAAAGGDARGREAFAQGGQAQGGSAREEQRQPGRAWEDEEGAASFHEALGGQGLS